MSVPKDTLWNRDPHTAAKHQILRWYLQAWFPILAKYNGRIVYFEGFAGPGEYEGREPGSPLVALDVAVEQQAHLRGEVIFYFVEAERKRADHLERLIEERKESRLPDRFHLEVHHDKFEPALTEILDDLDREGLRMAPTFAFIDPFGFGGLPMTLIHRLLKHPKTEAFINFPIESVNRFIKHPNAKINAEMVGLFGTEEALTTHGYQALRQLYQRQLERAARYVRFFTMFGPDRHQPIYDLFFATNSLDGLRKMKEAMWRVDPSGSFRFSDATDPNQQVLFDISAFAPTTLLRSVMAEFNGKTGVPVHDVEEWVMVCTAYREPHMRQALQLGEADGMLSVAPKKQDGSTRRRGSFPLDALINFVPQAAKPVQGGLFG